jgi:hypothetical protein
MKDGAFDYSYVDLDPGMTAPASVACQTNWDNLCRVVINYETHIHPLWSVDRGPGDTCIECHTTDNMGVARVPDAQLDLTDGASDLNADHFKSYRELLSGDNEQELVLGVLQDRLLQATDGAGNPLFQTDANGDLILDGMGNPIPVMVNIGVAPSMRVAGAAASPRFFNLFAPAGTHGGRLSPAELKLIAEWLDIGGQYYNNPFDVPP